MPITDVASFVKYNHHLPNVPSAEEVVAGGLNLGTMNAKLLEKIEELTLYLIEQNYKNEMLTNELSELKGRVDTLERNK
jgi:hypothetical protein